jgi:hypothetical protein
VTAYSLGSENALTETQVAFEGVFVAMDADEIAKYVEMGRYRKVVVDIRLVPKYPGIVRTVAFHRNNKVCINFNGYGADEGGYEYCCSFSYLSDAITAVENYLEMPAQHWENFTKTTSYPGPASGQFEEGCQKLESDVRQGLVDLPSQGPFLLQ